MNLDLLPTIGDEDGDESSGLDPSELLRLAWASLRDSKLDGSSPLPSGGGLDNEALVGLSTRAVIVALRDHLLCCGDDGAAGQSDALAPTRRWALLVRSVLTPSTRRTTPAARLQARVGRRLLCTADAGDWSLFGCAAFVEFQTEARLVAVAGLCAAVELLSDVAASPTQQQLAATILQALAALLIARPAPRVRVLQALSNSASEPVRRAAAQLLAASDPNSISVRLTDLWQVGERARIAASAIVRALGDAVATASSIADRDTSGHGGGLARELASALVADAGQAAIIQAAHDTLSAAIAELEAPELEVVEVDSDLRVAPNPKTTTKPMAKYVANNGLLSVWA